MEKAASWRRLLARLVGAAGTDQYPLCVFEVRPSSGQPWPTELPSCPGLWDFYARCDGGTLSLQYTLLPLADLARETRRWAVELPALSSDDLPLRLRDRMVVLGQDSGGALLVWDGEADAVSTLYWRGGGWEPLGLSFEGFMQALFTDPARVQADDLWAKALDQLG